MSHQFSVKISARDEAALSTGAQVDLAKYFAAASKSGTVASDGNSIVNILAETRKGSKDIETNLEGKDQSRFRTFTTSNVDKDQLNKNSALNTINIANMKTADV